MLLLACLLNLVLYAVIALFVLWVVGYIMSFFMPGFPSLFPLSGTPQPRMLALVYFLIGLVLLINFLMCAMSSGGHEVLPPLWHPQ
jgi:hypothetical protein